MNPIDIARLEQNYQPLSTPTIPEKKKDWKSAIAPFLPALGAAAGIGLAPFTGGGSLALIGLGAAGGALGKVGANKLEGKGAFDNPSSIALEGLFGAAGGAGKAFQVAKAAKNAKLAEDALTAARVEKAGLSLGKLGVGSEAKAGYTHALQQLEEANQFNSMAKQNIKNLASKEATRGIPIGASGEGGVLVKAGKAPSFASEGIELKPTPDLPYVPKGKGVVKPGAFDAYGVPLPEATGGTVKTSARQKVANALTAKGSGLKVGKNVGGASSMDEAAETLQRLKISGTPKQQLHAIETNMSKLGGQVDEILGKKPIQINGNDVKTKVAAALDDPNKFVELDLSTPGAQKHLNTHLSKIGEATNAKEVNDYIKVLNPTAVRARDKLMRGVALTDKETAALAAKKAGDEVLSAIPEIKPLKKDMAILFERNAEIAAQHGKAANIPVVGGVLRAPASGMRYLESKAGQLLAGQGTKSAGREIVDGTVRGNINKFVRPVVKQQVISGTGQAITGSNAPDPNAPGYLDEEQATQAEQAIAERILGAMTPEERIAMANESMAAAQAGAPTDGGGTDTITPQQLIQMVGADPQNANTYISLFKALGGGSGGAKPLSAEASKTVSNAQAGLEGIADLKSVISADPGALKRTLVPGRGLAGGFLGNVFGTNELEAARQQVVDVIARLRTGAAISRTEEARFLKFLPQPFDSPAVREQKLGYLERQFQRVAAQNPEAATDLEAAFMGTQEAGAY